MDIESFKLYKILSEEKNITQAASICNISQPAASIKIKKLEESYNTQLFTRKNKSFELTPSGILFLETVDKILELNQNVIINLSNKKRNYRNTLRIGATTGPANYILPPKLMKLQRDRPDIYIKLSVSDFDTVIQKLQKHEIDIGFVGTKEADGMHYTAVFHDEIILCAGSNARITDSIKKESLKQYDLYLEQKSSSSRRFLLDWLQTNDVPVGELNIVGEIGLPDALKHVLVHGEGVAFLPETLISEELDNGKLRKIHITDMKRIMRSLYLVYTQDHALTAEASEFIDKYL